ncbi:hypothetical protein [Actinomadura sp. WAC 06369]|uniref:hypothetical protein n=1 Tax=Actinomadura sp. WAC 06369 TaxID=2203193 RepID=UPI000F768E95|nr:hypothetical protein [Actinomadura sp. WAC 06369]RSN69982.1 hypothetical protein DMH08_07240 [Actinomadura sp. WAC 06369]
MRIPKRVNAVLDWMEQHTRALAVVFVLVVLVAVLVALVTALVPPAVGLPVAGFVLGASAGGYMMHARMARRVARVRREADDLLRENGALRHRYNVLASGVITREAQETQAIVPIPEDDLLDVPDDPQRTVSLPELTDELLGMGEDDAHDAHDAHDADGRAAWDGDPAGDTADLEEAVEESRRG